jgi:hypothetical protein
MYEIFQETKKHAAFVLEIYRKIRERLAVFKNEKSAYTLVISPIMLIDLCVFPKYKMN